MTDRVQWTPSFIEEGAGPVPTQQWDKKPWAYGAVSERLVIALLVACTLVSLFDLFLLATLH